MAWPNDGKQISSKWLWLSPAAKHNKANTGNKTNPGDVPTFCLLPVLGGPREGPIKGIGVYWTPFDLICLYKYSLLQDRSTP